MGSYYDSTIGTLLVGVFLNTFLYGVTTYQFVSYYRTKSDDSAATRYTVLFLFILDTFHSASVIYMAWNYSVTNYDNPAALTWTEWPQTFTPLATTLVALVTHIYLGHRIWCLTNKKILYGVVIVLAIPSFILGTACSIVAWAIKVGSEQDRVAPLCTAWSSVQVVIDLFITTTLIIILSRSRTTTGKMNTVLNRLIRGAIRTGVFPAIFSLGDLITFIVLPESNLHVMFAIPIGRIYTNTLLDSLLIRKSLRAEIDGTYDANNATGSINWARSDSVQVSSTVHSTGVQDACGHPSNPPAKEAEGDIALVV